MEKGFWISCTAILGAIIIALLCHIAVLNGTIDKLSVACHSDYDQQQVILHDADSVRNHGVFKNFKMQ